MGACVSRDIREHTESNNLLFIIIYRNINKKLIGMCCSALSIHTQIDFDFVMNK